MIDPNWDPYEELLELKRQWARAATRELQWADYLQQHKQKIEQLIEAVNLHSQALHQHTEQIQLLTRLLERNPHANTNPNTTTTGSNLPD